ncbi:MAG: DNA mismatch repair endonuclease MutL [Clostridia bacterium]|nr:DNA mismatch repair endonuclease MutL [Clostridia bacterium]
MGKIQVLSFDVANLIAAGEVVDRPASVIKELLENAIDAGATSVTVEIQNGGISFMRVSDDGCGMEPDELPVAVLRHATSKIRTAEDLDGIETLGFRGEALAAISSVSKVRIFSKTHDAEFGALMECNGGSVVSVTETGCAPGTTVIVEELFYNVPARRKFLKKDSTETVAVGGVVEKIALSSPEISIKYIADGEVKFMTAGDGNLKNTIYALYGRETASRLLPVDRSEGGIRVTGYVSEPSLIRSNRNQENFFINGRYIKSRTATAALEQAFVTRIPSEKFPFCVLNIELNPEAVDVNVHPAKLEVKFSNEKLIFDAVYYAVMSPLESITLRPELKIDSRVAQAMSKIEISPVAHPATPAVPNPAPKKESFWVSGEEARKLFGATHARGDTVNAVRSQVKMETPGMTAAATPTDYGFTPLRSGKYDVPPLPTDRDVPPPYREPVKPTAPTASERAETFSKPPVAEPAVEYVSEESDIPDYVIIGEAYNTYIIVQLDDRLIFIDKHAAHERIIFDGLCAHLRGRPKNGQLLLVPIEIPMSEGQILALEENRANIEAIGFGFKKESNKIAVTEIPTEIHRDDTENMLLTLADRLAEGIGTVESTSLEFFEEKLFQASCKAAIKGGRLYSIENIRWICDRTLQKPKNGGSVIRTCPHGRSVAFELSKNSMERQFSRIV